MNAVRHALDGVKLVLVTGGSSGIGKSFIESIRKVDADIAICNLSRSDPAPIRGTGNIVHRGSDLSGSMERAAAAEWAIERIEEIFVPGKLLIINNAGFGDYGAFAARPLGLHLEMIGLNVLAPVELIARLMPLLLKRGGTVINVASIAAFQPIPTLAVYAASKAFLLHWSLALGEELRREGIRVIAVCPGPTQTAFSQRAGFGQAGEAGFLDQTADQVVAETWRALRRGKTVVVTGFFNKVIAALVARLPKSWASRMAGWTVSRTRPARP